MEFGGTVLAHPFFDSASYPWHRREARELHEELSRLFRDYDEIDLLLRSCSQQLYELVEGKPSIMWKNALDMTAMAGLLPALFALLRNKQLPRVEAAILTVEQAVGDDAPPEHFIRCDQIFVNRAPLHAALRQLGQATSPVQVLLVRGGEKSGKSWTRHVVQAHAQALGHGFTYLGSGSIGTADDALRLIFREVGEPPARQTTENASFAAACRALAEHYEQRRMQRWIVVDDLGVRDGVSLLDPEVRELCEQIVLQMQDPKVARWIRLVLIDYPEGPLPTRWRKCWMEDRVVESEIDDQAVGEFLLRWARHNRKILPDMQAGSLATRVVLRAEANAANDGCARLGHIHDGLSQLLEKL
jgi:hypothetical protein